MAEDEYGRDHHNDFDMDSPEFNEHYYDVLNDLVTTCPVAHSKVGNGYYTLTGYEDVRKTAEDWPTFTSSKGFQPNRPDDMMKLIPVETDPPYHTMWRKVLNPFFTPEALRSREAGITEKVDRLMTRCVERGTCDFIEDFVNVLPALVFFESFLEQEESEIGWVLDVLEVLHTQPERAVEEVPKLFKFCADLLQERRSEGRHDDLAGTIAHIGLTGEDGLELTEKQRIEVINLMIMAGMATTMGAMGCTAY